jgi:hypothetical protein
MTETVELNLKYKGALLEGYAVAEEDYNGWTFSIELDDLNFRLFYDHNEEWMILRDNNALAPTVDEELIDKITMQIKRQRFLA